MWVLGLPRAWVPLWQVAQPEAMPVWLIDAGLNAAVDL